MDITTILFLVFAGMLLAAATGVITARNPVHAVLLLVLAFFSAACLWMLLAAEFLAIVLVLVYVGAAIALQLWLVLSHGAWQGKRAAGPGIAGVNNIEALGRLMFTEYVFPVQLAGLILLVGMVAAVVLTLRRRKDSKYQRPGEQVRVKRDERVRLVAMPADAEGRQDARR